MKRKIFFKNSDVVMYIDRLNFDGYYLCNDVIND